jgi:pyruvyl transferase EpsO
MYSTETVELPQSSTEHFRVISSLEKLIEETMKDLLPQGTEVALIDFPNHANVGDSAIWLGQKHLLRKLKLKDVFNCDWRTYEHRQMAGAITDRTVILLSGGGNIGDIWPEGQHFREAIIESFPRNQIIQLPQSISFSNAEKSETAKRVFNGHRNFTLLVRDKVSLNFGRDNFDCPIALCPDMAFQLGTLPRPQPPSTNTIYLLRSDKESLGYAEQARSIGMEPIDWLSETKEFERINRVVTGLWTPGQKLWRLFNFCLAPIYDMTAQARLARGLNILSKGKIIVTDRLHVHILCILMGIPHVVLDNSYGKVKNFINVWTKDSSLVHLADSLFEAKELVSSLEKNSY